MAIRDRMTKDRAETIGLDGLAFLAADPERLEHFLVNSGLDAASLRRRATERGVLRAVLDYLLTDDSLVTGFCEEQGIDAREMHLATHQLEQP